MPRKTLPRIVSVTPGAEPLTLKIRWDNGDDTLVDVSAVINSFRVYAPLRHSPERFGRVRLGEYGTDVVWHDDLDISNDTLWRLSQQ